jgi:nucleoside-diphosphate-sugar epimerase
MPMMYMDDAIEATVRIMQAEKDQIKIRSSYNLAAMSFTPNEIAAEINKHLPEFTISFKPDFRQQIADSWPASIDDQEAKKDWGWQHQFDITNMTTAMLENLKNNPSFI